MDLPTFLATAPTPLLTVVLLALYKLDRRLLKVETKLGVDD